MLRSALDRLLGSLAPKEAARPRPISTRTLIPQQPAAPALVSLAELNAPRLVENLRLSLGEDGLWRLDATMNQSCRQLRVCIDYAMLTAGPEGPSWGGQARLTLKTLADLAPGETLSVDVACRGRNGSGPWRWCAAEEEDSPIIGSAGRCRIAFIPSEGGAGHNFYFVIATDEMGGAGDGGRPILVGEHLFAYKDAWEAEAPLSFNPRWRGF